MTSEHLIPDSIGGRLQAQFLCAPCNSRLGSRHDSTARRDPVIVAALLDFAARFPARGQALANGIGVVAHSAGGSSVGRLENGGVRIRSEQLPDGSIVQPPALARRSLETMLRRRGLSGSPLERALSTFDAAPPDERVTIVPGLEVVNWSIVRVHPDQTGPAVDPLLPAKIAFEFMACHLGSATYGDHPPLATIRRCLLDSSVDPAAIRVDYLRADRRQDVHGILFEGNRPHACFQVRLFGSLAYRVHFPQLAVDGRRFIYTHDLESNREALAEAGDAERRTGVDA